MTDFHRHERELAALRAGDQRAWDDLVRRVEPNLRRKLRAFRLSDADIEDVLQAIWMLLHRRIATIRHASALISWLYGAAWNVVRGNYLGTPREVATEDLELRDESGRDDPLDAVLAAELGDLLDDAIATLVPRDQALVRVLFFDKPRSYDEIADVLEMPHGSIGPLRGRALDKMSRNPGLLELRAA